MMNLSESISSDGGVTTVNDIDQDACRNRSESARNSLCSRRTVRCNCIQIATSNYSVISEGRWGWVETEIDYIESLLNTNRTLKESDLAKLYQLISGSYKQEELMDPFGLKYFYLYRENSLLLRLVLFNCFNLCKNENIVSEFIKRLAVKIKNCINNWKDNHFAYEVKEGKFVIHFTNKDSAELDPQLLGSQAWLCALFHHFIESDDFFINIGKGVYAIRLLLNLAAGKGWGKDLEEKLAKEITPKRLQEHLIIAYDNLISFEDAGQKVKSLNTLIQILQYYTDCAYEINEQLIDPILEAAQNCMASNDAQVCIAAINLVSQLTRTNGVPQSSVPFITNSSVKVLNELREDLDKKREQWQLEFGKLEGECTYLGNEKGRLEEKCIDLKDRFHNWEVQYTDWEKVLSLFQDTMGAVIDLFMQLFKKEYIPHPEINLVNIAIQLIDFTSPLIQQRILSAEILDLYVIFIRHKVFLLTKEGLIQILNAVSGVLDTILSAPFSITTKKCLAEGLQKRDIAIKHALIFIKEFVISESINHEDEAFGNQINLINTIALQAVSLSGNKVLSYVLDLLLSLYEVGYLNKETKDFNKRILKQIEFKLSENYSVEIQDKTLLILEVIVLKEIVGHLPKEIVQKIIEQVRSETDSIKAKALSILFKIVSLPNSPHASDILSVLLSVKISHEIKLNLLCILGNLLSKKQFTQKNQNFSAIKEQLISIIKDENTTKEILNKAFSVLQLMDQAASDTLMADIIIKRISVAESHKDVDLFNSSHSSVTLNLNNVKKQFNESQISILIIYFKNVIEAHEDDTIRIKALDILGKLITQYEILTTDLLTPVFEAITIISKNTNLSSQLKNEIIQLIQWILAKKELMQNIPLSSAKFFLEYYSQKTELPPQVVIDYALKLLEGILPEELKPSVSIILEKTLDLGTQSQIIDLLLTTLSAKVSDSLYIKSIKILEKFVNEHMQSVKSQKLSKRKNIQPVALLFEKNNMTLIKNNLISVLQGGASIAMRCKTIDIFILMDKAKLIIIQYHFVQSFIQHYESNKEKLELIRYINKLLLYFLSNKKLPSAKQNEIIRDLVTYVIEMYKYNEDIEIRIKAIDILRELLLKLHLASVEQLELLFKTLVADAEGLKAMDSELRKKIINFFETLVESNFNLHLNPNLMSQSYSKKPIFPYAIASILLEKGSSALCTKNQGAELDALIVMRHLTEYLSGDIITSDAFSEVLFKIDKIHTRTNISDGHRTVVDDFFTLLSRIIDPELATKVLKALPSAISSSAIKEAIKELNTIPNPDYTTLEPMINVFAQRLNSKVGDAIELKDINGYTTSLCLLLLQKNDLPETLKQCIFKLFIDLISKANGITIGLIKSAVLTFLGSKDLAEEIPVCLELCTQLLAGKYFQNDHKDTIMLIDKWMDILMHSECWNNNCRILAFISQFIEGKHLTGENLLFMAVFYNCLATFIIKPALPESEQFLIEALQSLSRLIKIVIPLDDNVWRQLVAALNNHLFSKSRIIQINAIAALSSTITKCSIPYVFSEILLGNVEKLLDDEDLIVQSQALNVCAWLINNKICDPVVYEKLKNKALELWRIEEQNPSEGCLCMMFTLAGNNHLEERDIELLEKYSQFYTKDL